VLSKCKGEIELMVYMGSKRRLAKYLLPIILKDASPGQVYIEPFVGGANMICEVPDTFVRIGYDYHKPLIALLRAVRDGWLPPDKNLTREEYYHVKNNKDKFSLHYYAFIGFCGFGGVYWSGYSSDKEQTNYFKQRGNNLLKQAPKLKGITFNFRDYTTLSIPGGSIVYCDPPYQNTNTSKYKKDIDHTHFWNWCKKISETSKVFISSYEAPEDFKCIYEKELHDTMSNKKSKIVKVEKLFVKG